MAGRVARIGVALGARSYDVAVGNGTLDGLGEETKPLRLGRRCALISDSNVALIYGARVLESLSAAGFEPCNITVLAGEKSKSCAQAESICEQMIAAGLDRKAWVAALGGGVVGDLAGFAAAIYFRGIPYIQIPTTIVSQVDSSVGGKTGVNARGGKNLIGAFHQPRFVLADVATLETLPAREFNEGFAEVIKHAAIGDRAMLDDVENLDRSKLAELIARNVAIKARIVEADEDERTGERALLNFGHTIGHAIEAAAGYGELLHGEAISLGLVAACRLSVTKAGLDQAEADRVVAVLQQYQLPVRIPAGFPVEKIFPTMMADKKFEEGAIRFVLCPRLGEAFVSRDVTAADVQWAIESLA